MDQGKTFRRYASIFCRILFPYILFLFVDYFRELYQKDFEKLWANRNEPPIKQSAMVCHDLKEKPVMVMPLHEILIQLKSDTSKMVIDGVMLKYSEDTLLTFLKNIESSYAAAFLDASIDDKPDLDNNVKGFEHMSFDWALALCKYCMILIYLWLTRDGGVRSVGEPQKLKLMAMFGDLMRRTNIKMKFVYLAYLQRYIHLFTFQHNSKSKQIDIL